MLYIRLKKNVAGSDGSIFLRGVKVWAMVKNGQVYIAYKTKMGHWKVVLQSDWYEILICDPAHEEKCGWSFSEKNVKQKGGESG